MNQENYLKEVEKHLNCGKARKKQIRRELEADICAASEQGEEWEETRKRMGDPAELAREFNENMGNTKRKMSRPKKILLICAAVAAVLVVLAAVLFWLLPKTYPISASSIFQEETVASEAEESICTASKQWSLMTIRFSDERRVYGGRQGTGRRRLGRIPALYQQYFGGSCTAGKAFCHHRADGAL